MIDLHTHIFPEKIAAKTIKHLESIFGRKALLNGMMDGLLESSQKAGLSLSVILPVATKPSQFHSVNEFAAQINEENLISFGGIHPESGHIKEELQTIKNLGLKGIKLHPDYQGMYFNDIRYKRIVSCAEELGLITVVHAGVDPLSANDVHCTPQMASELIDDVKPEKLVLAHMGGNEMWDDVEHYLVGRHVYFDTAVVLGEMPKEQLLRMITNHGADKILFATDSPWADQSGFVKYLKELPLKESEKQMIFHDNAASLLEVQQNSCYKNKLIKK